MVSLTNGKNLGANGYGRCLTGLASGLKSISCCTTCSGIPEGNSAGNMSICLSNRDTSRLTCISLVSFGIWDNACCIGVMGFLLLFIEHKVNVRFLSYNIVVKSSDDNSLSLEPIGVLSDTAALTIACAGTGSN